VDFLVSLLTCLGRIDLAHRVEQLLIRWFFAGRGSMPDFNHTVAREYIEQQQENTTWMVQSSMV
jgi:hypothetical protein